MSQCRTRDHSKYGDGGVAVALAGQNQLTQRTAAQQHGAPAHDDHAQKVPELAGMGDRLRGEAEIEFAENQVAKQHGHKDRGETAEQIAVPEEHHVADAAHHAEAGLLRQSAHDERDGQRDQHRRMLGAGALGAGEEDRGDDQQKQQQPRHDGRQHATLRLADGVSSFERKAVFEEQHADTDARDKADEAYQRVQITAAQTEHHPQRAAQKDQRADHDEHAQHESGRGGRARLRAELARCERHDERAQHQAQDLRAQILHLRGAVQAERARDVPLKAGDAEAHVGGVSQRGQRQGRDSDDDAGQNHEPVSFFHDILSFLFWHFAIFIIE